MIDYTDLIGTPFVQDGRGQGGYDCYGLTKEIFARYGKDIGEYWCCVDDKDKINAIYRGAVKNGHWREIDFKHGEPIPVPALVGLRFNAPLGVVNHTGVYIGDGKFIHTRERIGVCVNSIAAPPWHKQIVAIYQFLG